jgi:hypothetical protein
MLRDRMPVASQAGADVGAADQAGAIHQPYRQRAVGVLPEDIGLAVGVEVAGAMCAAGPPRGSQAIAMYW